MTVLRKMLVDFKLGVLGASYVPRAIAAWATTIVLLAFGVGGVAFGVIEVVSGIWVAGLVMIPLTLVTTILYLYMGLDAMADAEQQYRKRMNRRYHERNAR